jgi:hypothetical protein
LLARGAAVEGLPRVDELAIANLSGERGAQVVESLQDLIFGV